MIAALTIAEPVAAWLQAEPRCLRVHSAFPHAINLLGDDGRFLVLLARDAGDGPFAARLACHQLPDVPAGTVARVDHATLAAGPLLIDWRSAGQWDPTLRPPDKPLDCRPRVLACLRGSDSILVEALRALTPLTSLSQLREKGELDSPPPKLGEGWGVGATPSTLHSRFVFQAARHLAALHAGLQGDDTALAGAARALLGFGVGLTPAGDDCLLGVLAARRMSGEPAGALEATIRDSASRTTALSAAFLRAACNGQFAGHWHHLRQALQDGGATEIEEAARHVLTHGATSGADALAGWVLGMAAFGPRFGTSPFAAEALPAHPESVWYSSTVNTSRGRVRLHRRAGQRPSCARGIRRTDQRPSRARGTRRTDR